MNEVSLGAEELNHELPADPQWTVGHVLSLTIALIAAAKEDKDSWEAFAPTRGLLGSVLVDSRGQWPDHIGYLRELLLEVLTSDEAPENGTESRRGHARPMPRRGRRR